MARGRRGHRPKRPAKHENLLALIRYCLSNGMYRDTRHVLERRAERQVSLPEILQALESGFHERRKDEFKEEWQAWNYAIRGWTVDRRELRIVVSFDEEGFLLLITSVDLGGGA
ncbi:MAG: DUF4258 domain-containing protein [Planctomycetes bacterium]|nr:DUF4258 domain-containing protein [Planctomycetota bacterium]